LNVALIVTQLPTLGAEIAVALFEYAVTLIANENASRKAPHYSCTLTPLVSAIQCGWR